MSGRLRENIEILKGCHTVILSTCSICGSIAGKLAVRKGIEMKSIKTKLIISFIVLVLAVAGILGYISLSNLSEAVTYEAESALASVSAEGARVFNGKLETQKQTLHLIASDSAVETMSWTVQKSVLEEFFLSTSFLDFGIADTSGISNFLKGSQIDFSEEAFFKEALNGSSTTSDILLDEEAGTISLYYAVPIKSGEKVTGVLLGKRDGNELSEITDEITYGSTGYSYLINGEGTVIAHGDREKVSSKFNPIELAAADKSLTSVSELLKNALETKTGISSYSFEGRDMYAGYAAVTDCNWVLIITADKTEVLASLPKAEVRLVVAVVLTIMLAIPFIYLIGHTIVRPVMKVVNQAETLAAFDLTVEIPDKLLKKKDETGRLANAMKHLQDNLRGIVCNIVNTAEQVSSASEELTATTQESAAASEEIARTASEISKGANEQAAQTENGAQNSLQLGTMIEEDMKHICSLSHMAGDVSKVVEEGLTAIESLSGITKESNIASNEIYQVILNTNDSSNKISEASNVIAAIADQTNLLALNAAIEAARAGEAGKGFSVVAEEIRKLAEQSQASTTAIDTMVKELQHNSQTAVTTMERVAAINEEQTKRVAQNREKYVLIEEAMNDTEHAIVSLEASGAEKESKKEEIREILNTLTSIAEENSAATQEVTASIEEQTASVEEIARASESLSEMAQDLQAIVKRFKV
jgi:methyl-accepting chemotaxis protein